MMDPVKPKYPQPRVDEESKGFWEGCERSELYVQQCENCGTLRHYPRALCPRCLSGDTLWRRCSGKGSVYTYTVVHQNQAPSFRERVPYILAYVELEEGVRLLTNIVRCGVAEVRIGMPVEVVFEVSEPGAGLAMFAPAATAANSGPTIKRGSRRKKKSRRGARRD